MPRTLIRSVLFVATCVSAFAGEDKNRPKSSDDSQWLRAASEQVNLLKNAIKHYQRASSKMTWSRAGQSLKRGSDIDGAVAEYRKALEEDPDEPYWHLALAMALKQKGDRQGILDDYEVALKLAPDDDALRSAYDSLLGDAPD